MGSNERDFARSAGIGGVVTLMILSAVHDGMSAGEVITFWVAVHMVSTGIVWWAKEKCRDAWQCISRH